MMNITLPENKEAKLSLLLQLLDTENVVENVKKTAGIRVLRALQQQIPTLPTSVLQKIMACTDKHCSQMLADYNNSQITGKVYDRLFSEAEIGVLIKFYSSNTGKKMLALGTQIMEEITLPMQQRLNAAMPNIQADIQIILAESGLADNTTL